jgi:hypothetical protein
MTRRSPTSPRRLAPWRRRPLAEANLDGRTYALDYQDVTWAQPAGLAMVSALVDIEYVLLAVLDVDPIYETIETAGSLGISDPASVSADPDIIQDPCVAPVEFGVADFSGNPVFEIGPADFPIDIAGQEVVIDDAYVHAVFVEDGAAIEDIQISGQLDTTPLATELGFDICNNPLVPIPCVPCNNDPSSVTCVDVLLTADRAEWQENIEFDENLDPSLNPSC